MERILRLMKLHWVIPRRRAPASDAEEKAATNMQSAFRGHRARLDVGLVSKDQHAEVGTDGKCSPCKRMPLTLMDSARHVTACHSARSDGYCSPRSRMPFHSRDDGPECV